MNFAFDLHGLLDKEKYRREAFLAMAYVLKESRHNTYLVSGPEKTAILQELELLDINPDIYFTEVVSVVDYLKEVGVHMWEDSPGHWYCEQEEWEASKGQICEEYGMAKKKITTGALDELKKITWTGNIREFRNVLERLIILCDKDITDKDVIAFAQPISK